MNYFCLHPRQFVYFDFLNFQMYFEKQNKAVAIQEEAYKWSVADM